MGGATSAGMCVVLESLGLVRAFDRIYGCSAGALNGSATAAGQAALGSTNYLDTANRTFANPLRLFVRRPVLDFDFLFKRVITDRKPIDWPTFLKGPEFRALAVSLQDQELVTLKDFESAEDLLKAVRVSASLPIFSGSPLTYHGRPMADGGLIESIPFLSAIDEGASHVLVLRSRPIGYRKEPYGRLKTAFVARKSQDLADLVENRPGLYNREAELLETWGEDRAGAPGVALRQINVPPGTPAVPQLRASRTQIAQALRTGASALGQALLGSEIDLIWTPSPYFLSDP